MHLGERALITGQGDLLNAGILNFEAVEILGGRGFFDGMRLELRNNEEGRGAQRQRAGGQDGAENHGQDR